MTESVWTGLSSDVHDTEDEIPDDVEESDRCVAIPRKDDLDLGSTLAFRFVDQELPEQGHRVADIFHHRGAYPRFKDLLASHHALDKWYAYEKDATQQALREWCAEHDIGIVDESPAR